MSRCWRRVATLGLSPILSRLVALGGMCSIEFWNKHAHARMETKSGVGYNAGIIWNLIVQEIDSDPNFEPNWTNVTHSSGRSNWEEVSYISLQSVCMTKRSQLLSTKFWTISKHIGQIEPPFVTSNVVRSSVFDIIQVCNMFKVIQILTSEPYFY